MVTCPTGIDIRDGLQMECVGCAQCIDACDAVMDKIGRPRGLIRYSSQETLQSGRRRLLRPRVVLYPILLVAVMTTFAVVMTRRASADISVLRVGNTPYRTLTTGEIANDVQIKIVNRAPTVRGYRLEVAGVRDARIVGADPVLTLDPGGAGTANVSIVTPADVFDRGRAPITVNVSDGVDLAASRTFRLQGPFTSPGAGPDAAETPP